MVPSDKLTFALVGHGQAASSFYKAMENLSGVHFRWAIGRRLEGVTQFAHEHGIPNYGVDLEAALADHAVEFVLVCSPNQLHYPQAMRALQAGKHVVVEVPMTMSYRDAQTLVRVATEKGRLLSVAQTGRYLTSVRQAKELLAAGELGSIYHLVYRRLLPLRTRTGWTGRPRMWIDSVSWHQAAHALDLASWLLNQPLQCTGAAIAHNASHEQSTDLGAVFVTPLGTIVTVTISYSSTHKVFDCVLVGERGLLELQDLTVLRRDDVNLVQEEDPFASLDQAYQVYARELIDALRGRRPMPASGAEVLPIMKQLELMHVLAGEESSPVDEY